MRSTKLTPKILQTLNPKTILYAELAESGAMGCPGTIRIFTLENQKLKFYFFDVHHTKNHDTYGNTFTLLNDLSNQNTLEYQYAGFGNHAYKKPKIKFTRNDDQSSFIYQKSGQTYQIPTSCSGVYSHIVAKFATREIAIDELEDYLDKNRFCFTSDETSFFDQYLIQIKRTDQGQNWFDFTAINYYSAVKYLRHLSGEDYLLNPQDIADSQDALNKYRLQYIVDKLGWNQLDKIFAKLVKTNSTKLFPKIKKSLDEKVEDIYSTLKTIKSDRTNLNCIADNNLENLFNRPILVDFSKSAHAKIIQDILNRPGNSFNPDSKSIAYYLANYLLNEARLPFSDILPAVIHIIEVMPDDNFNHTHTDELFWLCGEIIDRAWRYLEENDATQQKYRTLIYKLYWPRVGSLWPILNRDKFNFNHESAAKIFDDSVNFVLALDDITERNPEIKQFVKANQDHIGYNAGPLGRRAFVYSLRNLSSKQELDKILSTVEPADVDFFLRYPSTIKDAKNLLTELFRTDNEARITGPARLATFEALLITPNTINVGEYILNYLDTHFDSFTSIISAETEKLGYPNPLNILTDFFIAMSKGITEENEFPPLKSIQQKLTALGCNQMKLQNAMRYARHHRRTILFQRSALQKLF